MSIGKKKTNDDFLIELKEKNDYVMSLDSYVNARTKIRFQCKTCGYIFKTTPGSVLCGSTCAKCKGILKKSHSEFVDELCVKNPSVTILSTYNGNKEKVVTQCNVCEYIWNAAPSHLLNGHGCPQCAKKIIAAKRRFTHEQFMRKLNTVTDTITVLGVYVDGYTSLLCHCNVCNTEWSPKPYMLLSGRGCPQCGKVKAADKRRLSQKEFEDRLFAINPNIIVQGKFYNVKEHIDVKCNICGHIWSPSGKNLLNGYGCPNCSHGSTSYPEQYIYGVFVEIFGDNNVCSRDTKAIGRELDIYVPTERIAVEYGTWHWHENKLNDDKDKIGLCKSKNIKLITILDNCPSYFNDSMFWCYYKKLSQDDSLLQNVVFRILDDCNLSEYIALLDFNEIAKRAKMNSRKKSTFDFIKEMSEINDSIEILGEYGGSHSKIECQCKKCQHIWYPSAGNLLAGYGCPNCGGTKKLTQFEFLMKLQRLHPYLVCDDKYINGKTKLHFRCKMCNFEFDMEPSYLWTKKHCPVCKNNNVHGD